MQDFSDRLKRFFAPGIAAIHRASPDHPGRAKFDPGLLIYTLLVGNLLAGRLKVDLAPSHKIYLQSPELMTMDIAAMKVTLKALKEDPILTEAKRDWRKMHAYQRLRALNHIQKLFLAQYPGVPAYGVNYERMDGAAGWVNNGIYHLAHGQAPTDDFSRVFVSSDLVNGGATDFLHGFEYAASVVVHECCHVIQMSLAARQLLDEWNAADPDKRRELVRGMVKDESQPADWQKAENIYVKSLNRSAGTFAVPASMAGDQTAMRIEFQALIRRPSYYLRKSEQHAFRMGHILLAVHRLPEKTKAELGEAGIDRLIERGFQLYRPNGLVHSLVVSMPRAIAHARKPTP